MIAAAGSAFRHSMHINVAPELVTSPQTGNMRIFQYAGGSRGELSTRCRAANFVPAKPELCAEHAEFLLCCNDKPYRVTHQSLAFSKPFQVRYQSRVFSKPYQVTYQSEAFSKPYQVTYQSLAFSKPYQVAYHS